MPAISVWFWMRTMRIMTMIWSIFMAMNMAAIMKKRGLSTATVMFMGRIKDRVMSMFMGRTISTAMATHMSTVTAIFMGRSKAIGMSMERVMSTVITMATHMSTATAIFMGRSKAIAMFMERVMSTVKAMAIITMSIGG